MLATLKHPRHPENVEEGLNILREMGKEFQKYLKPTSLQMSDILSPTVNNFKFASTPMPGHEQAGKVFCVSAT